MSESKNEKSLETSSVLPTRLSEEDRQSLSQSIMNRKMALLQAEKTLAQHELAEANYKNFVLQVYMKYGLKTTDTVTENGDIVYSSNKVESSNEPK